MTLNKLKDELQIVSHRGLPSDFPENTMVGYRGNGAQCCYVRNRCSFDQRPTFVVIHDETIDRTSDGRAYF